ncbi:type III polyketide synthase [Pseudoalteromonas sp. JBTF-M23]|uniref:Type III polyketide synthase n=1 Tax=Pseudoalteromonas caenipelagi TaxID=2726988 RepID=A0A849VJJ9_9GAMM|nr:3,5-dihydroxyphenylacetyl-CoA synthase DpgA [Pseudoalteromonas caenipelagi]NOU52633.1 type III polyketide synthase [Pseudoalteromonas caenipelagi]
MICSNKNEFSKGAILSCAHDVPEEFYIQKDVADHLALKDERLRGIFINSGIEKRHLTVPVGYSNDPNSESQAMLIDRHEHEALKLGSRAIEKCLEKINKTTQDIDCICCVTSTGFLVPSLSARFCKELNLKLHCNRIDIVGMGCSAGLNGLDAVKNWANSNPGKLAVVVCTEICSAAYVSDGTIESCVVNSLFGDGASAAAVMSEPEGQSHANAIQILSNLSLTEYSAIDAMKFAWDDNYGKNSFYLSKDVPYVVGSQVEQVISDLLTPHDLKVSDIEHWVVHSGGKKVIDSICINLGLTKKDLKHTRSVLKDFGNLSSGSFLFSLERLINEGTPKPGDFGVLMTMGPGAAIETALVQWT